MMNEYASDLDGPERREASLITESAILRASMRVLDGDEYMQARLELREVEQELAALQNGGGHVAR